MFSNLVSYFGYGDNSENAAAAGAGSSLPEAEDVRLTTVETEEDDWLMVQTSQDAERRSSTASLPNINLEESWFVTPPPCFTSTGPVTVETSPLENLLIEHPSMSVYHRGSVGGPRTAASPPRPQRARSLSPRRPVQPTRLRAPLQPHQLHNLQVQACHHAQKHQLMKETQVMKPKQMDRQNKARDYNKRNKRQRRADRQKNHSGANNNRKCC